MQSRDDFRSTITSLWARLGMGEPRFGDANRVRLRVESVGLDLIDNGRGALEIEGVAGRLDRPGPARANQVRRILESNLGLLLGNDAGVFLRTALDGETALAVRSSYAMKTARPDRLIKKIEDVVRLIEYYAGELKSANVAPRRQEAREASSFEPAVIFRP
jgi:hypothetical protein